MHACKSISSINSNNNYNIIFDYLNKSCDDIQCDNDINTIVNCIRLNYKIDNITKKYIFNLHRSKC